MVITSEIAPSPVLAPYIRCFSYHQFDTLGFDLKKPWHASSQMLMDFYFDAKPVQLINPNTGQFLKGSYGHVLGLGTQYNGEITFNGSYSMFSISFKPTGFNKVFRLSPTENIDLAIYPDEIFDQNHKLLFEQLCAARGLVEMASQAETYLLYYLNKQKSCDQVNNITRISNIMLKNPGHVPIQKMAYDANMSLKSFERHFTQQVGITPKSFYCITRFNHALKLKFRNPERDWTSIGNQAGYFDQMHLIKDFKKFAEDTPSSFIRKTHLTSEKFTSKVEA